MILFYDVLFLIFLLKVRIKIVFRGLTPNGLLQKNVVVFSYPVEIPLFFVLPPRNFMLLCVSFHINFQYPMEIDNPLEFPSSEI